MNKALMYIHAEIEDELHRTFLEYFHDLLYTWEKS